MGRLLVLACARCRRAKVAERGKKTTTCGHCSATIRVPEARVLYETDMEDAAREAAGVANARLAGREGEYQTSLASLHDARAPAATPRERAVRAARSAPGPARVEAAARALGEFTEEELTAALADAGVATSGSEALRLLAARRILVEPRPGRFRVVD